MRLVLRRFVAFALASALFGILCVLGPSALLATGPEPGRDCPAVAERH